MHLNFFTNEMYSRFVESFIEYLESKLEDKFWLMTNHNLVEDMFDALDRAEETGGLIPALKILEKDPAFASILDETTLFLLNRQETAA
jgi:hypothetical protein